MKKLILTLLSIMCPVLILAQDGAEHKIINIIGAGRVELNVGQQFGIKVNDVFQVFGKGQVIHPATGRLVERDNVYIGKLKIIQVKELSSIAEIIEKQGEFSIGNTIVKAANAEQEIIENKRPVQAEFENPKERDYSETIYTQKEKKAKAGKDVHIIEIQKSNGQESGIIDKGDGTKARGGKPVIGKKYFIFVPVVDTSSITGQQSIVGEEYIGEINITGVEHDASVGSLVFHKESDFAFIEKNNTLLTYLPKYKGIQHFFLINTLSLGIDVEEKPLSIFNGIYTIHGSQTSPLFFIGGGIGFKYEYYDNYAESLIKNLPLFIHGRFNILKRKTFPTVNLSAGRSIVLNTESDYRVFRIRNGWYFNGGIGLSSYILKENAFLMDINFSYSHYNFEYPAFFDTSNIWNNRADVLSISILLGYSF